MHSLGYIEKCMKDSTTRVSSSVYMVVGGVTI